MKKLYTVLFLLFSALLFAQEEAWIYFNAKPNAQQYLDNPLQILSQPALDRRVNQKIDLNFTDAPIEKAYVNQVKNSAGITILAQSKWLNALHVLGNVTDITALKNLAIVDRIDFADKSLNGTLKKVQSIEVLTPTTTSQIQTVYNYGNSANQIQMLNGHLLHENGYTGQGKIIAVIDAGFSGVDTAQPFERLQTNNQILGGYDFVSRTANFYTKSSHGTSVLSTIGGYTEGKLVGTAPDASFYLFTTEDETYEGPLEESLWVEAAEKADSLGVDIITTSLGYFGGYTNPKYSHTYTDMDGKTTFISRGAEIAFSKGIFIVASAGNEGSTSEPHVGAPADATSVLTVGAVNSSKTKASFSSIGPTFDNRIKPEVMAQGQATYLSNASGVIGTANGTSFSCPIIAGMVACLWQAFPEKTNHEIKDLIISSSDRFTTSDNQYGFGIPDFALAATSVLSLAKLEKNDFILYPNPTENEITFILSENNARAKVLVFSVLGQKLLEAEITFDKNKISLQDLPKGMYFYTLEATNFDKSGKIIKQ